MPLINALYIAFALWVLIAYIVAVEILDDSRRRVLQYRSGRYGLIVHGSPRVQTSGNVHNGGTFIQPSRKGKQ